MEFSNLSEKKFKTPIISEISLWIILLSKIDFIILMFKEICGCQIDDFYYFITIYHELNKFRPVCLSNYWRYGIDHRKQNDSKWNICQDRRSEIFFCMIWKSIFCHNERKSIEMGGGQIRARGADLRNRFFGIGWDLNKKNNFNLFWTTDVDAKSLGSLTIHAIGSEGRLFFCDQGFHFFSSKYSKISTLQKLLAFLELFASWN